MRYALWSIAAIYVLSTLVSIARVGKERKPVTPGEAAVITVVSAVITVVLVLAGLNL